MNRTVPEFYFAPTGIGSVPFTDVPSTCGLILERFPAIPFWPQFVKRGFQEDIFVQYAEGLPFIQVDEDKQTVTLAGTGERESALVTFYEHFLSDDVAHFAITPSRAPGLHHTLGTVSERSEHFGPYIKGQSVGPVTFASGLRDAEGNGVYQDPNLVDAVVKGLAIKALWQVEQLSGTGKQAILFLDEPSLSGFGSAFSPVRRGQVIAMLREILDYVRERSDALLGIHCCGNTDWPMILETGPDILSFDAWGYMDTFLLYPEAVTRFVKEGGAIAWGIVPTEDFRAGISVEDLLAGIRKGLAQLKGWGLDPEAILRRSILTPACGMGTMDETSALRVIEMLRETAEGCARDAGIAPRKGFVAP